MEVWGRPWCCYSFVAVSIRREWLVVVLDGLGLAENWWSGGPPYRIQMSRPANLLDSVTTEDLKCYFKIVGE